MKELQKNWDKEIALFKYANDLLAKHNLVDWTFMCMRISQTRLLYPNNVSINNGGLCDLTNKRIVLNQDMVYEFKLETMQDIFLHELAHAIGGVECFGHTPEFRRIAKSLGCKSILAKNNHYILDMYGTYKVTAAEETKCCNAWMKKQGYI